MDEAPPTLADCPPVRLIWVGAGDTYLVLEWFARLSAASTWRQMFWVSLS